MEGLTIGRIIHYVFSGQHLAAVVVFIHSESGLINATVFRQNGDSFGQCGINYSEGFEDGTWHWPERK